MLVEVLSWGSLTVAFGLSLQRRKTDEVGMMERCKRDRRHALSILRGCICFCLAIHCFTMSVSTGGEGETN